MVKLYEIVQVSFSLASVADPRVFLCVDRERGVTLFVKRAQTTKKHLSDFSQLDFLRNVVEKSQCNCG